MAVDLSEGAGRSVAVLRDSAMRVLGDRIERACLRNQFPDELLLESAPDDAREVLAYLLQRLYHAADLVAPMAWTCNAAQLLAPEAVYHSPFSGKSQPGELRELLTACVARLGESIEDARRSKAWLSERGARVFEAAQRAFAEFSVASTFLLAQPGREERSGTPQRCAARALVLVERIAGELEEKAA